MWTDKLAAYRNRIDRLHTLDVQGRVCQVIGTLVEASGPRCAVGDLCQLGSDEPALAEVVGFRDHRVLLMPLQGVVGVSAGCPVRRVGAHLKVGFSPQLRGRILDGLGRPLDGLPLPADLRPVLLDANPPSAMERGTIEEVFPTGVSSIDALLTMGCGQRVGLFAGSGVGKSTLLGMIARESSADVNVIALVGERGREVRDFVEHTLGPEGLAKSVVIAATSDQAPMLRIKAALLATALAEAFRDEEGQNVLLMMDSVTRVALAQREIGLAVGEPPTTRGYTSSVFTLLPRLLERAGPSPKGNITALYTVLVEGDDMNEPIADAVRGILDGHFVLSRELAHQNHYPALDMLGSVSRLMNQLVDEPHRQAAARLRNVLATCREARDLVNLGAYTPGCNPKLDRALALKPRVDEFLRQSVGDPSPFQDTRKELASLMEAA